MATDVIIDPSTGQIYWNDSDVSAQSISIKGDAQNTIKIVGYSGAFSPGSTPGGANTLATFTDNGGTDAFIPGTNGYDLGKDTARWRLWATSANFSGDINASSATQSTSLLTGAIKVQGGLAVSSNASIGQTLFFFNPSNELFTGFRAGAATANTVYTLPPTSPATGSSVLQSTSAGVMSWVPLAASSASGGTVYNGTVAQLAFYGATGNTVGGASGVTYNPTSGLFYITHTTPSFSTTTGALVVTGGVGIGGSIFTAPTSKSSISGVSFNNSRAENGFTINASSSYTFNIQDAANNQRLNYHADSNRTEFTGNNATHEIRLIHSNNSGYTGFKANSSGAVTYTLPAGDGSNGQALTTNGSATLSWTTITGGAGGGGTGVQPGGEFEIAYYTATGASVSGSSTFKNDTTSAKVSITHTTSSISSATGALTVSGGAGIGGSLWVTGIGSSISGVRLSHSIAYGSLVGNVTGNVSGNVTGNLSGNITGNVSGNVTGGVSGNVTGNVTGLATTAWNVQVAIGSENLSHTLLFTRPTSTVSGSGGIAVSNDLTLFFNPSTEILSVSGLAVTSLVNSTSTTTGALNITGGASIGQSLSIGGRLQLFNSSLSTAFLSAQSGVNTTYTLPATSPTATGTSVLSSTMAGVMSWVPLASGGSGGVNAGTQNFAAYYATTSSNVSENSNLIFTGTGLSVGGNIASVSTITGSLQVRGGVGITGNAFIGGTVNIQDGTVSSSTTTGALIVTGGVGVGGKVFADVLQSGGNCAVGGNLTVAGTVDLGNTTADSISFLGRVDTDIDPIASNTYDLGESGLVWKNVSIGSSAIFYNTTNGNTLGFRAGVSGASLIYVFPIDTPNAGEVLSASAPSGGVVTLSWEADQTGAPAGGITTLNTLTAATQSFATGTAGNDFAISSATSTHTFNLPDASATARGVITTGTQTIAGAKTFSSAILGNVSGNLTGNVVGIAITAGSTHVSVASAATAHSITVVPTTSAQVTVGIGQSIVSGVTVLASTGVITAGGFSGNVTGTVSGNVTGTVSGNVTGSVSGNVTGGVSGSVTGNLSGLATTAYNIQVAIGAENLSHTLLFTRPTSTVSGSGGIAVSNDLTLFFNPSTEILSVSGLAVTSTVNSITTTSGALIVTGGASVGQSVSIGGRLQLFNSTFSTAFLSAQAGVNTTYTLPTTSPAATGTSVLSSTMAGVMSWVPLTSTVGGSGTPGGSNKQIQYNNASSFGGAAGFEYSSGGIAITVGFFAPSGLGYTSGLWINAINGSTTRIGIGLSNPQFELEILGELSATNKSFVINHPTKSGLKLRYGSLEGPENGVYVRGELKGTNIIEVPDHWVGLVHEDSYTVHLTPIGKYTQLYVEKIENYNVFVAENNNSYIHCYYSVWAERKDIPKLVTEYEAQ